MGKLRIGIPQWGNIGEEGLLSDSARITLPDFPFGTENRHFLRCVRIGCTSSAPFTPDAAMLRMPERICRAAAFGREAAI